MALTACRRSRERNWILEEKIETGSPWGAILRMGWDTTWDSQYTTPGTPKHR